MKRAVITAVGKDSVGRLAELCNYLAEKKINILDVSQTLVGGFFNLMIIVDVTDVDNEFSLEICPLSPKILLFSLNGYLPASSILSS